MSDYKMEITGEIGLSDYSNIYDYIGIVDNTDSFYLSMNNSSNENISIVSSMLKDSGFNIINEGYDSNGKYFINAYKNK